MSTKATIVKRGDISSIWESIIDKADTFIISDVDGTLNERDSDLCRAVNDIPNGVEFTIATSRSFVERLNSTKNIGESLAKYSPIIIAQGGAVIADTIRDVFYIVPLEYDMNRILDALKKGLKISRKEIFRKEHLCFHFFDMEKVKEVIGIPIAKEDEADMRAKLLPYNGDIITAYYVGALKGEYSLAIEEYIARGMPDYAIGVAYESEFSDKIITELTIVGADLQVTQNELEKIGVSCRIQQHIANRKAGTRGCLQNVKPDIADIVSVEKRDHIDYIIKMVQSYGGITIGLGDQANDDFLLATDYSFVANAAPMGKPGEWDFAVEMAKRTKIKNFHPQVIHCRHAKDGTLINWVVEAILACCTFEERKILCSALANSKLNHRIRKQLLNGFSVLEL